mmetsp:Transcript_110176/g.212201  ORF Transcript_110176/g.212201 Transcript_110176/m.212201 type:complete len:360 (-) Transcript_110176:27-1106(-)
MSESMQTPAIGTCRPNVSLGDRLALVEKQIADLISCRAEHADVPSNSSSRFSVPLSVEKMKMRGQLEHLSKRLTAVETGMRELDSNFVQYQQDLAPILLDLFGRITQQMRQQEDKLLKSVHDEALRAITSAREELVAEFKARPSLPRAVRSRSSLPPSAKSYEDTAARDDDADVDDDFESQKEPAKFMNDIQKNTDAVHEELQVHMSATEERVAILETSLGAREENSNSSSRSHSVAFSAPIERTTDEVESILQHMRTAVTCLLPYSAPNSATPGCSRSYIPQVSCGASAERSSSCSPWLARPEMLSCESTAPSGSASDLNAEQEVSSLCPFARSTGSTAILSCESSVLPTGSLEPMVC